LNALLEVRQGFQPITLPHGNQQISRTDIPKVGIGSQQQPPLTVLSPLSMVSLFDVLRAFSDPPIGSVGSKLEIMRKCSSIMLEIKMTTLMPSAVSFRAGHGSDQQKEKAAHGAQQRLLQIRHDDTSLLAQL
jgi:hypothetical protein